jgi:hypothetical protein
MKKSTIFIIAIIAVFIIAPQIAHANIPIGAPPPTDPHPIKSLGTALVECATWIVTHISIF